MCLMIAGFAFAFMVVSFGLEGDVFKHPLKSGMTTLTMVLGEFNFGELYQAFGRELLQKCDHLEVFVIYLPQGLDK